MARVWADSKHSGTELLMLLAIADFADDEGNAYPAVTTLAAKCRMKPRNANYILAGLQSSGELEVRVNEGPKGTNRYRVMPDTAPERVQRSAGVEVQRSAGLQRSAGVQRSAPTPAMECAKPLQHSADEPSLNHQEPPDTSLPRLRGREVRSVPCPQDRIRDLYHEVLPTLPRVRLWGKDRAAALRSRWGEMAKDKAWTSADDGVQWFRRFFERVETSDFLMGRTQREDRHAGWRCDIDFLLSPKGFRGVLEGKYNATQEGSA